MKIKTIHLVLLLTPVCLMAQKDKEKATEHYETALAAFTADYTSQEDFITGMNKADVEVNNSLRLDQTNPEVFFLRGKLFAMQKRWEDVIEVMDYAIQLDDSNWEYYMRRGMTHGILKHKSQAMNDLNKAIDLAPDQGAPYLHRGMQYYGQLQDKQACMDFQKALKLGFEQAQGAIDSYCGG